MYVWIHTCQDAFLDLWFQACRTESLLNIPHTSKRKKDSPLINSTEEGLSRTGGSFLSY